MKIYLANGLFSEADRLYNSYLAQIIRKTQLDVELFLPQESEEINDKNSYANSRMIANWDTSKLLESDVLVAVIDGVEIDSGVATEIGIFSTTNKPIIGLFTDVRQQGVCNEKKINALMEDPTENQFIYRNLFTVGVIKKNGFIVSNIEDVTNLLKMIKVEEN